jgi:outer membrane biosynthesis protein TonB
VSYWDRTLVDVDLIPSTMRPVDLGGGITLSETGCTVQLHEGITARLKKSDKSIVDVTDDVIHVGKDEVMHIKQGNLDFVLAFIHIPTVTLPQMQTRDALFSALVLLSSLLYISATVWIYLTQVTPAEEIQQTPWTIVSLPRLPEKPQLAPLPVPPPSQVRETQKKTPTLPPKPVAEKVRTKEATQESVAQTPRAAPSSAHASTAAEGSKAPPGASSSAPDFSRLKKGLQVLNHTGPGSASIGFKDPAAGAAGDKGADKGLVRSPSLNPGNGLTLTGAGATADQFQKGTGTADFSMNQGFEAEQGGRSRADVTAGVSGDPVSGAGLSAEEVQKVIRIHLNGIRHCYEQLLQKSPSASGKIKVHFVVGPDGRVSTVQLNQDTIGDATMSGCVMAKISRWTFPMPSGGQAVHVNYPFVFNPR